MTDYYFKCKECWRVYDLWQLTDGPIEACSCSSHTFKNTKNLFIRRLLTAPIHTIKTLFGREIKQ